jgi:phosphoglycerate dehydrogenase-like enzyme
MLPEKLRVAIGAVITPEQAERIAADPRLEVLYDPAFMPPQAFPSDLFGAPDWRLSDADQARYEEMCASAHVWFGIPQNRPGLIAPLLEADPDLFWIHTMAAGGGGQIRSAGLSAEQLDRLTVTTSAGVHARPLTEFAMLGLLAGAMNLPWLQEQQRAHVWGERHPLGHLADLTVLVVGMGGIGRMVTERLRQFGATVLGVNRSMKDVPGAETHLTPELVEVAARADALVNCLPAAVGTDSLLGGDVLAALKPGAIVVSVGRGSCIDEPALIDGLSSGHIGYAALDVTAVEPLDAGSPLWDMPNVLISPHIAAVTTTEIYHTIELFLDNVARLYDGRPLRNVMNKELFY